MNSFLVEITNCGQCPYAWDITSGYAVCEGEGGEGRSLDADRYALLAHSVPIPDWCPMLQKVEDKAEVHYEMDGSFHIEPSELIKSKKFQKNLKRMKIIMAMQYEEKNSDRDNPLSL